MIKSIYPMIMFSVAVCFSQMPENKHTPVLVLDSAKTPAKLTKSRVAFGSAIYDFGQVPRNTKLLHKFMESAQ